MFDANTTIIIHRNLILHVDLSLLSMCLLAFLHFFLLHGTKTKTLHIVTVVHKKSSASFIFFHVSKRQDRHFIVSQNAPTRLNLF